MTLITRRKFLTAAALTTGATAVSAIPLIAGAKEYSKDIKWSADYDVVVIGYGGAGAAAAIAANDKGSKVLIVEKMAEGGGNTAISSGGYICPDDAEKAKVYIKNLFTYANSELDEETVNIFAEECVDLNKYVDSLKDGLNQYVYGHAGFPTIEGSECIRKFRIKGEKRGGDNLFDAYRHAVEVKRKIDIKLNTSAKDLIRNCNGEIIGVSIIVDGKEQNIKAKRGVVLTSGGFEYNENMMQNYVKGTKVHGLGSPGNTGDGILMAQKAGAALWHMTGTSCPIGVKVPGLKSCVQINMLAPSHIWVDQDSKRFVNEQGVDNHARLLAVDVYDPIHHRFPRIPCFMVFDEKARKKGPISGGATSGYAINRENYKWSFDNSKEIKSGIVKKADTLEELARILGIPADSLVSTVAQWNADIKSGKDTAFSRPLAKAKGAKVAFEGREAPIISEPLDETGPYYAVEMIPTILNTQGGPKRNAKSEVLDPFNTPIPRLYAAGEIGSFWGLIYQGGGNNAESMVFGQIAGRNVADLKPWK